MKSGDLKSAKVSLVNLLEEKEELEVKIAKQRRVVAAWELIEGKESSIVNSGLKTACSAVLRCEKEQWLTIPEICSAMKSFGFDGDKYVAFSSTVQSTVMRLVDSGDVEKRSGQRHGEYRWRTSTQVKAL